MLWWKKRDRGIECDELDRLCNEDVDMGSNDNSV